MASWSAENATKAYLTAFKMSERTKEPDVTEFISAIAAGNNAQKMVVTCAGVPDSTILLAMVAAAHQTQGRVICIVHSHGHLNPAESFPATIAGRVEFLVGEPQELLLSDPCNSVDFVLVDCHLENHEEIFRAVCVGKKKGRPGTVIVGYNALNCKGSWRDCGSRTQFLPIGKGLLVTRFRDFGGNCSPKCGSGMGIRMRSSRWVVKIDKCTGEEHVFRVRMPHGRAQA